MAGNTPKRTVSKAKPALLAGGNPQIAKGEGDAPVQAYIAALSGWQREVVRQLDALIVQAVPAVQKAVKWNSPLYGVHDAHRFLSIHVFAKYVKVAFMNGTSLTPVPPGESRTAETRYLNIFEADTFDASQFTRWVQQASMLPGVKL